MDNDVSTAQVAAEVGRSRKYRCLCRDTLDRASRWAVPRSTSQRDAVKRAKRKLHQVYGAYLSGWRPHRVSTLIEELDCGPSDETLLRVCAEVLREHASTRERSGVLREFYDRIFALTGRPPT